MIAPRTLQGFESPSLVAPDDDRAPAFELKFLLDESLAARVESWARDRLTPDPHGDPALGGAYRTTTIFLDTPDMDVYHRSPWYRRRKLRVRRYGQLPWVFIECKSKKADRVAKERSLVPDTDVPRFAQPASIETWDGHWFHRLMLARQLRPACRVSYLRAAFVGACAESPLRLTIDRGIHGVLASDDWRLLPCEHGLPLLKDRVILELKFLHALPGPFKELVRGFAINPSIVSKYRACREAWGLPPANAEVACA